MRMQFFFGGAFALALANQTGPYAQCTVSLVETDGGASHVL
jgi:hypothetical protein